MDLVFGRLLFGTTRTRGFFLTRMDANGFGCARNTNAREWRTTAVFDTLQTRLPKAIHCDLFCHAVGHLEFLSKGPNSSLCAWWFFVSPP